MENIDSFKIIGIATRSTNENGKSAEDLGKLWEQFYTEKIPSQIANKISDDIYAIYTDYASDYRGTYTCIIGLKVKTLDKIPEGLVGREFKKGKYERFLAKGPMPNAVIDVWKEIWWKDKELKRNYIADFEVYGDKSKNGEKSEVAIFIGTK